MFQSEIGLSDLIRAIRWLDPSNEISRDIAVLLGYEIIETGDDTRQSTCNSKINEDIKIKEDMKDGNSIHKILDVSTEVDEIIDQIVGEETRLVKEVLEDVWSNIQLDVEPLEYFSELEGYPVEFIPLFEKNYTRSIITSLLSVNVYEGDPDISKIFEHISLNLPLDQLPLKPIRTLRYGAQVLVDIGPGFVPYIRDQEFLLHELKTTVGKDRIEILAFKGTPLLNIYSYDIPNSSNYHLPPSGTPILMLTDLGISAPLDIIQLVSYEEWATFIKIVHNMGCPLLALIPYEASRWPKEIRDQLNIVQWDRKIKIT